MCLIRYKSSYYTISGKGLGKSEKVPIFVFRISQFLSTMGKQVIVRRSAPGIWETLEEAAEGLGVSVSTVSRMLRDMDPDIKYVSRVYAIRLKDSGEWTVAVLDHRGRNYVTMGQSMGKIKKGEISEVRDITVAWYLHAVVAF